MSNLRLLHANPSAPTNPSPTQQPVTNHLKLLTKESQLGLFDENQGSEKQETDDSTLHFCANLDLLALRHSQEDSVLGLYILIQDLFKALSRSENFNIMNSHFMVWTDDTPTFRKHLGGNRNIPFWTFHLFGNPLSDDLVTFVQGFLISRIGWHETGWATDLSERSLPMFEYRHGEPIVFFAKLTHPNGQQSIGYPEIFYRGDDIYLGFGSIPKPMKRAALGDEVDEPLMFTVHMTDDVIPNLVVPVSSNLTIHPCGLTEPELIARCPQWNSYTEKDRDLFRKYGPAQ